LDRTVRVASLSERDPTWSLTLQGITRSADRAALGLPVGGRLDSRAVRVGDRVARGDVLARLDPAPWRHAVEAQTAGLAQLDEQIAQLDRDLARLERLGEKGSVAEAERERLQAQRDAVVAGRAAARAQLDEAERQQRDSILTAPFDGVVVAVDVEPGETVAAGSPVVTLAGDGVEVEVEVPEAAWVRLTGDDAVRVRLPALDEETEGHIVDLAGASGRGGLFPVVVAVPPGPRRVAGLSAEVRLDLPLTAGLVAPLPAIVDPTGTDPAVFVVDDDSRVRRAPVTLGALHEDGVAVAADGLAPGTPVVVAGHAQLFDGERVSVVSGGDR
jgi:RND family efflux transporter MFP subunit